MDAIIIAQMSACADVLLRGTPAEQELALGWARERVGDIVRCADSDELSAAAFGLIRDRLAIALAKGKEGSDGQ